MTIVGIDLGTTNSEIAALVDGKVQVIGRGDRLMLPSCVGLSPAGELLVGEAARNQQVLYPERTVRSIKRKMGTDEKVALGDKTFTPQEISSLLLRELVEWAKRRLNTDIHKAIITVPAYFSDAQRNATREAGALAGLEVVRILNEPTAASLAYGYDESETRTVMVFDLGGGTFDVSLVRVQGDVTEVLASHGNNHLGGDDFNNLLFERLAEAFRERHGLDVRQPNHSVAASRLWWAAEEAKIRLSSEPYARVREDALVTLDGKPLNLDLEVARDDYEDMIRPLVDSTLTSVTRALADANLKPSQLDAVLLVGGSTRTPLVKRILEERTGLVPHEEVHPDLCVALGAGVLAARVGGADIRRVLVDVSPFSFGISHLGLRGGVEYPYCYRPTLRRNSPLPVTRTEIYLTSHPYQKGVEVHVFQGDDPDALKNIPVGDFHIEGLKPTEEPNEILCRMSLDIDGILHVAAIEKATGLTKQITIKNAFQSRTPEELDTARARLRELFTSRLGLWDDDADDTETEDDEPFEADEDESEGIKLLAPDEDTEAERRATASGEKAASHAAVSEDIAWVRAVDEANGLLARSQRGLELMHEDDKEEAIDLHERIRCAMDSRDPDDLAGAVADLRELLFFVEGSKETQ